MTTLQVCRPRIYVACLSSYNAGHHHGAWLDITSYDGPDELEAAVQDILSRSSQRPAEEWAIHDFEGFGGVEIREHDALRYVWEIGTVIAEGEVAPGVVAAAISTWPESWTAALSAYRGVYGRGEYGEEIARDRYGEKELGQLADYIDWERYEADLEMEGEITVVMIEGDRHIFAC